MVFPYGKYKDQDVEETVIYDRNYCIFLSNRIKNKEKYKELYLAITKYLNIIEPEPETPNIIKFGKYIGISIEKIVLQDKAYSVWLLNRNSFKEEYPKTRDLLKRYFEAVYTDQLREVMFFYILNFCNKDYVKVGITSNYIVKRMYAYTHTTNIYHEEEIDYKNSLVYMTNDLRLETKVLDKFKSQRVDKRTEKIKASVLEIDTYIQDLLTVNQDVYYTKKCIHDFIPFDYGYQFKDSLRIKINEFVRFREVYEEHLNRLNLINNYNPDFMELINNLS